MRRVVDFQPLPKEDKIIAERTSQRLDVTTIFAIEENLVETREEEKEILEESRRSKNITKTETHTKGLLH